MTCFLQDQAQFCLICKERVEAIINEIKYKNNTDYREDVMNEDTTIFKEIYLNT